MPKKSITVVTPKGRASFVNIWEPQINEKGEARYTIGLLIPKSEDISGIRTALQETAAAAWPSGMPQGVRNPIKDGDADVMQSGELRCLKYPEVRGHWLINAKSAKPPQIVDNNVQPLLDRSKLYSGCYVRVSLRPYTYNRNGNQGIAFGLGNIQVIGDGDPLGGGTRPEDDFAPIDAIVPAADPFAGVPPQQQAPQPQAPQPQAPQPQRPAGGFFG